MLADILVHRASAGADRDRDDLHRHATFEYGLRSRLARLLKFLRLS
jgi:hypothetical protein